MTSGMSAKGSALGASGSGSGDQLKGAPAPRTPDEPAPEVSSNGTAPEETLTDGIGTASVRLALSSSVRTIILGIDYDGQIVQHDRIAPRILAREPDELLGAQLSDRSSRPEDGVAAVSGLLEAIR